MGGYGWVRVWELGFGGDVTHPRFKPQEQGCWMDGERGCSGQWLALVSEPPPAGPKFYPAACILIGLFHSTGMLPLSRRVHCHLIAIFPLRNLAFAAWATSQLLPMWQRLDALSNTQPPAGTWVAAPPAAAHAAALTHFVQHPAPSFRPKLCFCHRCSWSHSRCIQAWARTLGPTFGPACSFGPMSNNCHASNAALANASCREGAAPHLKRLIVQWHLLDVILDWCTCVRLPFSSLSLPQPSLSLSLPPLPTPPPLFL